MRLDKYLKTARILKRREAAKELALAGRIWVNDRIAKPSTEIKIGDQIRLRFGSRILEIFKNKYLNKMQLYCLK